VPPAVKTLDAQVTRCLQHMAKEETNIRKNLYLQDLHNRNETLYFKLLTDNIEEMAPLVYTPTVGEVCTQFGWQFRRTRSAACPYFCWLCGMVLVARCVPAGMCGAERLETHLYTRLWRGRRLFLSAAH
jgi:hypothetical protein